MGQLANVIGILFISSASASCSNGDLGKPCRTAGDCDGDLICQSIYGDDGVGRKQCTIRCDSSEDCELEFGDASCTGPDYCALDCDHDGDCPEGTRCSPAHSWCELVIDPAACQHTQDFDSCVACCMDHGTVEAAWSGDCTCIAPGG